jgi:hypothetical protein
MLLASVTNRLQLGLTKYVWLASMLVSNADKFGWATDNQRSPCGNVKRELQKSGVFPAPQRRVESKAALA